MSFADCGLRPGVSQGQELMRHGSIQTTMNVYGQAMLKSKSEANSKVVEMALRDAPLPGEVAPAMVN